LCVKFVSDSFSEPRANLRNVEEEKKKKTSSAHGQKEPTKKKRSKKLREIGKRKKNSPNDAHAPLHPRYNDVIANLAAALTRTSISCLSSHFGFRLVD
jgi:hypothetical protein